MYELFYVIAIIGIMYFAILLVSSINPVRTKFRLRRQFHPDELMAKLHSDKLQATLKDAGLRFQSRKWNFIRYGGALLWVSFTYLSNWMKGNTLDLWPLFFGGAAILLTVPKTFLPVGFILERMRRRLVIKKDGELVAWLRLYENNRQKHNHYMQFSAFCIHVSSHFQYIDKELLMLSQRNVEDGLEDAMDWLLSQYPKDHEFIHRIRTIILTTESLDQTASIEFLKQQSQVISQISSEQYLRRWTFLGDIATVFNTLPSAATFIMMLVLVITYLGLIQTKLSY